MFAVRELDEAFRLAEKASILSSESSHSKNTQHTMLAKPPPADYYRGDPQTLLAEWRRRLQAARELRKQENIELRQSRRASGIPWLDDETTPDVKRQTVSL